ncbi:cation efflux protein [Guyanagaster necrorhizus]|uniref:Cation efflux protein n=1 Tax=Guyanagaster necrorhizus TaxID=856835 RepID=A0A9P8AQ39_9AGAR|nr:cation efflux protein [Guyanagaster necrorhizus MCA 3950]KAG7443615.1 cation efflux protein [Guyanagaster necrorhizus MCA 3950]
MPVPDAKTRSKISLNPRVFVPSRYLPKILISSALFATSLHLGKDWLLEYDVGIFWVVMRVLACGGVGVMVWEGLTGQLARRKNIEWSALGTASLLLFAQQACLFTALYRLSSIRVTLFTQFSSLWVDSVLNTRSPRRAFAVVVAFVLSVLSDAEFDAANFGRLMPGYVALLIHGVSSAALNHTLGVITASLGTTFTIATTTFGASIFALPFYIFRTVLTSNQTPALPLISLAAVPFIAYSLLFFHPLATRSLAQVSSMPQHVVLSYPFTLIFASVFGPLAFSQIPCWTDLFVAFLIYIGLQPESVESMTAAPRTSTSRLIRSYLKTILSNAESRKIFYFLMLNMAYMLVQMLYGVWTNSLGLISDAIHMAFDCMAIGVGLFASVMATWEPNERYTYGYGRIETLSGFANGIFLILISIFIVFEAIQRILEPPEMNTSQLLLVSSLGLAVNLFGMFAMGGHHHHVCHSHSHGHSHSHNDHDHDASHLPHNISPPNTHSHSHSASVSSGTHLHSHSHSHSHSQSHTHSPDCDDSHLHLEPQSPHVSHEESHSDSHTHTGSHSESDLSHSHSHSPPPQVNGHHSHGPELSHPPSAYAERTKRHIPPSLKIHSINDTPVLSAVTPHVIAYDDVPSPITPTYRFGDDHHLQTSHSPSAHHHDHEGHSDNMRGVFLHVMADTLGSVGVIVSTLLIQVYGWTGFDPIASLFIAVLIAGSVLPLVIDTGKVLCLDVAEQDVKIESALSELRSIEGLASYSQPRFWPKDASKTIGSIHIQLAPSSASVDPGGPHSSQRLSYTQVDRVTERVDTLLRQRISGLEELTIQAEEVKGYTTT